MTDHLVAVAGSLLPPDCKVIGATARFGARYVATRAAYAIAGHAALDSFAEHREGVDAVILACFGDPGLFALRELTDVPVIGMAEASCRLAARDGRRFAIVTGGERWPAMLREFIAVLGLSGLLAGIRAVHPAGGEIAANPAKNLDAIASACLAAAREDGAEVVVLGGAGLVGIADALGELPVPTIDCLSAAVERAQEAYAQVRALLSKDEETARQKVKSIGLSRRLARLLAE